MAVTNFEEEFIIALLHNPKEVMKRANRAQLSAKFFQDDSLRTVFNVVSKLIADRSEVTPNTVETAIIMDKSIDITEKPVLRSMVGELYDKESSAKEFAINVLKKRVKTKLFMDEMKRTMVEMVNDSATDATPFIDRMFDSTRMLKEGKEELEVTLYNSYEEWEKRKAQRNQETTGKNEDGTASNKSIKMTGILSAFKDVFWKGFAPATITVFGGNTGVGKSLMLTNIAREAISPSNGLNGLFMIAENKKIESESRLDSVLLDRSYQSLWSDGQSNTLGDMTFGSMQDHGWGKLYTVKVEVGKFDAQDIENIFDEYFKEQGVAPEFLIIDSPDHMAPVEWASKRDERKAQVYIELKQICDKYQIPIIASLPLKASSAKLKKLSAEDGAGSYEIVKLCDHAIFFLNNDEDELLERRSMQLVKNRGGKMSDDTFRFKLKNSLILEPWDEEKVGFYGIKDIDTPSEILKVPMLTKPSHEKIQISNPNDFIDVFADDEEE